MKKIFYIFIFSLFINSSAFSVSKDVINAIENCADYKWARLNQLHITFEQKSLYLKKTIEEAKDDNHDNIVEHFSKDLDKHIQEGEKNYNLKQKEKKNFLRKKLKTKLQEKKSYDKRFEKCEKERKKSPIKFEAKWN